MTDQEKNTLQADEVDAKKFAALLKDARRETLFSNFIGVALSSYMNGVNDTCRSLKAIACEPARLGDFQ